MKAIYSLLFVLMFSVVSFAEEFPGCLGADEACKPVPAGKKTTQAGIVSPGPTRDEVIRVDGDDGDCAKCVAERAQKEGRLKGGASDVEPTSNDKAK